MRYMLVCLRDGVYSVHTAVNPYRGASLMTTIKPWRKHTTTGPPWPLALGANVSRLNKRSDTANAVLRGRDSAGSTRMLIHYRAQILSLVRAAQCKQVHTTYSNHNRGHRMKIKITTPKTCVMPGTKLTQYICTQLGLSLGLGL